MTYYTSKIDAKDPKWMLELVERLTVGIEENENDLQNAHEAVKRLYPMKCW